MDKYTSKNQKTTVIHVAICFAKIIFFLIGIASTLFSLSTYTFPFILRIICSFSFHDISKYQEIFRLSTAYLFIIINFIILIIWKLNMNQAPDCTELVSELSRSFVQVHTISPEISESVIEIHTTSQEIPEIVQERHTVESTEDSNDYPDSSLDATWKAIIQKQFEKNDSWDENLKVLSRAIQVTVPEFIKLDTFKECDGVCEGEDDMKMEMRKAKTFREWMSTSQVGWKGRNVWVERDEMLRSKVEAFIKMNYDQMRLQRESSCR